MDELIAPDYDTWDQPCAVTVSLGGITSLLTVLVAPENFSDYLANKSYPVFR